MQKSPDNKETRGDSAPVFSLMTPALPTSVTPENTRLARDIFARYAAATQHQQSREEQYDWGYNLYWASAYSEQFAESVKCALHPEQRRNITTKLNLLAEIHEHLRAQREAYPHYAYFNGYTYQSLRLAGVFGNRDTESRFEDYGLGAHLRPDMHLLDIGSSAGFMAIYAAFRYGCTAYCVEHNRHMNAIGRAVARYMNISDKLTFRDARIQAETFTRRFDGIFSFAAHWTDDEGIRVNLGKHMQYLHSLLNPGGILFFESHSNDIGDAKFDQTIEDIQRKHFTLIDKRMLEGGTRAFFVLQRPNVTSVPTSVLNWWNRLRARFIKSR